MPATCDISLERNTSDSIRVIPNLDYSDFDFVYIAKKNEVDTDDNTNNITITPYLVDTYISTLGLDAASIEALNLSEGQETIKTILINFLPNDTKSKEIGIYYHSLRAISSNKLTVIDIFNGKFNLVRNIIRQPL